MNTKNYKVVVGYESDDEGTAACSHFVQYIIKATSADYGSLEVGKSYRITTEGNRVVNMFFQEYPYITEVEPIVR